MLAQLAALSLVGMHANVVPPSEPSPSSVELKSAYCIGILEIQRNELEIALKQAGTDARVTAAYRLAYAGTADRLSRLRSYLVPRSIMIDTTPLEAEVQRATSDATAFASEVADKTMPGTGEPDSELIRRVKIC